MVHCASASAGVAGSCAIAEPLDLGGGEGAEGDDESSPRCQLQHQEAHHQPLSADDPPRHQRTDTVPLDEQPIRGGRDEHHRRPPSHHEREPQEGQQEETTEREEHQADRVVREHPRHDQHEPQDREQPAEQIFEARAPAASNRVTSIVPAYDKAVGEVLKQLVPWANAQVARPTPGPRAASQP